VAWLPPVSDLAEIITAQNPWMKGSAGVPATLAPATERPLAKVLWQAVQREHPFRYQVVIGPRRVGKTTAVYQTVSRLLANGAPRDRLAWFRLDHPVLMRMELGGLIKMALDVFQASEQAPLHLFLDELTYANDWDKWLKTFYDEHWPVRVVATSSSSAALISARVESGVGRWEEQFLPPWLFGEYLQLQGHPGGSEGYVPLAEALETAIRGQPPIDRIEEELERYLLVGGFPELLTLRDDVDQASEIERSQRVLRTDAVQTALYKDLQQVHGVAEPVKLERLLYTLGGQVSGIVSPSALANALDLSQPTIDRYISYLEKSFLVFTLPNYSPNEGSVQRRGRKLYFYDGAIRNAALQRGLAPLRDTQEMGVLFENAAAAHLYALSLQEGSRLYHWRDGKLEVDLVLDHPDAPTAFEITASSRHSTQGLQALIARYPRFKGRSYVVQRTLFPQSAVTSADGIGRIPFSMFLREVSAQVERALRKRVAG
jgi:predicted AAA+ superfamily ATPase